MISINKRIFIQLFMAMCIPLIASAGTVKDMYKRSAGGTYIAPSKKDVEKAKLLFSKVLRGDEDKNLAAEWHRLGFELSRIRERDETFIVVREHSKKGGGFYLFRNGEGKSVAIQAPHRFYDERTGVIVRKLMLEGQFRAAAWNTVGRYEDKEHKTKRADMSHQERSFFQAFTLAFSEVFPEGNIVQFHGFSQSKRSSHAGRTSDIIISSGSRSSSQAAMDIWERLKAQEIGVVRLFPHEVSELGATQNSNARALRQKGFHGFIHVEMSKHLRVRLSREKALRRDLYHSLVGETP